MRLCVLDASAWLRLFLGDGPVPASLLEAATDVEKGKAAFAAPELILVEAAAVVRRKCREGRIRPEEADGIWKDMLYTPLDLLRIQEDINAAFDLSRSTALTVYDALYLAAARRIGATLLTVDQDLHREAARLGLAP